MIGGPNAPFFVMFALSLLTTFNALALEPTPITDNVYAIVGPMDQRNPKNLGNNATFGFVVTDVGVVLIDSGGPTKVLAKSPPPSTPLPTFP